MQICQPSTAAQYFHVLRRQILRAWRTPLIVFTPKSMLRHVDASSTVEELGRPRFLPVLPEREVENPLRVLVCTGKMGHELRQERSRRGDSSNAIVVLDQLYPFPVAESVTSYSTMPRRRGGGVQKSGDMGALKMC